MLDGGRSLCLLFRILYGALPLKARLLQSDAKLVYENLDQLILKHINCVFTSESSGEENYVIPIGIVITLIKTLIEVRSNIIDPHILVRVLQLLVHQMGSSADARIRQVCCISALYVPM